ncbi:MAG: hypothetical protein PHH30_02310 [Bacteroidales bacterium]|jgi:hypothetical protein|nr:hypothetical protein [Bacteroidales bacterium]
MKNNKKSYYIILFTAILFYSCSDDNNYNQTRRLLIKHDWKINTFVDYSQNQTTEFRTAVYDFLDDNTLIKTYENNDTILTQWQLSADSEYLTIGSNTFRITELTNRVFSIRYGELEMFFIRE